MEESYIKRGYVDPDTDELKTYKLADGTHLLVLGIRESATLQVTIKSGKAESEEIDVRRFAGMAIHMPAEWTAASLGLKASPTSGGTFQPVYDDSGSLVQITGTGVPGGSKTYIFPAEVFPLRFVKLWSQDGSGSNTNQGADRTLTVDLKA